MADTPAAILAKYEKQAGAKGSPERGKAFFTQDFKQVLGWTCSSCHTADPTRRGTDQLKEKPLEPLAPKANPKRLTDAAKVENAFTLNCADVVGRKCTPQEKADVLAWLISAGKE
jgi:cytochrome c553